jgi:hypothetical protein
VLGRKTYLDKQKAKLIVVSIWVLLLISTLIAWTVNKPKVSGTSNSSMVAGETKVVWFNAFTGSGEIHRVSYDASAGPIEIYIVTQDSYNVTSHEVPETYLLYHYGNSTTLNLDGPLPFLYYIVISEVGQDVYVQSWVFSTEAILAQMLVYPLAILTSIVSIFGIAWYPIAQKPVKRTNGGPDGFSPQVPNSLPKRLSLWKVRRLD